VDVAQKQVSAIQGKPFAITEGGPASPDVLGKTNSWWITQARVFAPAYKSLPWTWQTMTYRLWKYLLEAKGAGAGYVQTWLQLWDYNINDWSKNSSKVQYEGQDLICGWDSGGDRADVLGCGPLPVVDGEAMVSWWLNHGTPLANWLSGSPMTVVDPMGGYTNGTPGLHFWMWQFADDYMGGRRDGDNDKFRSRAYRYLFQPVDGPDWRRTCNCLGLAQQQPRRVIFHSASGRVYDHFNVRTAAAE
jgi:hypothetical protein